MCLQLGRLRMGKEALLAAILSGVLRPGILSEHPVGFGSAPVTLVDIREGFGPNVARLVAGLEHVTCVEETAHSILRGSTRDLGESAQALSPSSVIGVEGRTGRKGAGRRVGRGDGVKRGGLRDASILEQVMFSFYKKYVGIVMRECSILDMSIPWQYQCDLLYYSTMPPCHHSE